MGARCGAGRETHLFSVSVSVSVGAARGPGVGYTGAGWLVGIRAWEQGAGQVQVVGGGHGRVGSLSGGSVVRGVPNFGGKEGIFLLVDRPSACHIFCAALGRPVCF